MSGFTGSFEEHPHGEGPFGGGFQAACPSCGENLSFEILLDLYKMNCPGCGKYAILYFWGKEKGPHLTEDLAYMFLEEGLLSEDNLENALETKKQSAPMPFVEFLLSIQYVTVSELEELARRLIPDDWGQELSGESYRQPPSPEIGSERDGDQLSRSDVDALYSLMDQIYSGCGHPFSKMRAVDLERLIRSLGGDLTAGTIRTRFGRMILNPDRFTPDLTETTFAQYFSDEFELQFTENPSSRSSPDLPDSSNPELFRELGTLPLSVEDDILNVGVAGHLLGLGFGQLFDLARPKEVRNRLQRPVSFSIMPVTQILKYLDERYRLSDDLDLEEINHLLQVLTEELRHELLDRYRSLDSGEQPVPPGDEMENPSAVLRAIFQSISIHHDDREPSAVTQEDDAIKSWLYHSEAPDLIPDIINQNELDELFLWGENQVLKSDHEQVSEVPDHEQEEFQRLRLALTQLSRSGHVRPELLNLPAEILEGISEIEAGVYEAVPIARAGGFFWFCVAENDRSTIRDLCALTSENVRGLKGDPEGIGEILVRWYGVRKGAWMPDELEASIGEYYGLSETQESEDLPPPDPEAVDLIPQHIAKELQILPLKVTPEEFMIACTDRPVFVDRQIIRMLVRRSISYRFISRETFNELFERAYAEETKEEPPVDASRWDRESVEDLLGAPLSLEELETPRRLLSDLEKKKDQAPEVNVVTDPDRARTYPVIYEKHGQLHIDEERIEDLSEQHWTPAMETFFPAVPLLDQSPELIFASSSLDRRWFLETLGFLTNRPVHVIILPKSALNSVSSSHDPSDGNGKYGGKSSNGGPDQPAGENDDSSYIRYEPPHLFDSFHELAEQNQLKKLLLILLVYLLEHPRRNIRIQSDQNRCRIYTEGRGESEELFSIEAAHVYGIRYALQELAGLTKSDFQSDEEGHFRFVFEGRSYKIQYRGSVRPDGQELLLETEIRT